MRSVSFKLTDLRSMTDLNMLFANDTDNN